MSRKLASTIIALCASFLSVNALADTFAGKVLDGEGAPLIGAVIPNPLQSMSCHRDMRLRHFLRQVPPADPLHCRNTM